MDELHSRIPTIVRDAIAGSIGPLQTDIKSCSLELQQVNANLDRRGAELRSDILEAVAAQTESIVTSKVSQAHDTTDRKLEQTAHKAELQRVETEKRIEAVETQRMEQLRQSAGPAITHGRRANERERDDGDARLHSCDLREADERIPANQRHDECHRGEGCAPSKRARRPTRGTWQRCLTHSRSGRAFTTAKMEETTASVQELVTLHEQTRTALSSEMEGTKQWAARNMQRLKKHLDVINSELLALKETSTNVVSQVDRLRSATTDEREKLHLLLQQKTKEADVLTKMVDSEIASIHQLAEKHTTAAPPAGVRSAPRTKPLDESAFGADDAMEGFIERSKMRGEKVHSLYDELAFRTRDRTSSGERKDDVGPGSK